MTPDVLSAVRDLAERVAALEALIEQEENGNEELSSTELAPLICRSPQGISWWARRHPIGAIHPSGWQLVGRLGSSATAPWRWRKTTS